jgi:3D (Asp-Asp-Asp) domain-containing protein
VEKAMLETHSCNRYFQACSLIPFCTADGVEERRRMLDEMVAVDLSPSELAAIDKHGE